LTWRSQLPVSIRFIFQVMVFQKKYVLISGE